MAVGVFSIEIAPNRNPNPIEFLYVSSKTSRRQIVTVLALRVNMLQLHHRRRPSLTPALWDEVSEPREQ